MMDVFPPPGGLKGAVQMMTLLLSLGVRTHSSPPTVTRISLVSTESRLSPCMDTHDNNRVSILTIKHTTIRRKFTVPVMTSSEVSSLKLEGSDWTLMGKHACVVGGTSSNNRA